MEEKNKKRVGRGKKNAKFWRPSGGISGAGGPAEGSPGLGVRGWGSGAGGPGLGVWGLGFGVWSFGIRGSPEVWERIGPNTKTLKH